MEISECHVLEFRIGMNVNDHRRPEFFSLMWVIRRWKSGFNCNLSYAPFLFVSGRKFVVL